MMKASDEDDLTSQKAGKGVIRGESSPRRQVLFLIVAVVIVGIVAIFAVVLSALSLGRPNTPVTTMVQLPNGSSNGPTITYIGVPSPYGFEDPNKIWVFAIGHDGTNLEYIDNLAGTLRGFHVDIVEAVCNVANKNCRLMWDIYENCYRSKAGQRPRPGPGLVSRWYDGCTGWFQTYERISSVSFTKPFRKPLESLFYVKRGNPGNFSSLNLTGKTIGFADGDASNEFCIQREKIPGANLPAANIRHYSTREEIIAAVNNSEVDALFTNEQIFDLKSDLDVVMDRAPITTCMLAGAGMMLRKDSLVTNWWDPAFDQLKQTSAYRKICSEVLMRHNQSVHSVDCVL
ncbi:uncharacterized protein LOC119722996 [Patiria miniata]|uniref:Uncharacterized protein n=1 Tax=Patiria miniata TaxID=46514 RepID=A0A913ZCX9_PATMI|nr:uncharacterized protein LOC119722996 [Patiria miniata]